MTTQRTPLGSRPDRPKRFLYALLAAAVLLVGIAGYIGFLIFPGFGGEPSVGIGLLALAAGAGIAAFFSPCSFGLLLTLLSRLSDTGGGKRERLTKSLAFAFSLSIGATLFVMGVGTLISLGGEFIASSVTFTSTAGRTLRIVFGLVVIVLALGQIGLLPVSLGLISKVGRPLTKPKRVQTRPSTGFIVFGFGYLLAGFG